ncbi:hypothetical protein EPI10_018880 [Gossypium australe]|uniref:Uncharacterized protein n=1 Tax=Gossypium australe TaxID=47621 RepID=A0A5B6UG59_9ROSI|nr:hypothetical protein EPI10_018880 [Gossypium australe]
MLRYYVLEFKGNWEKCLLLVEFTYTNIFQSSIRWYCMTFYVIVNDELCYIGRNSGRKRYTRYWISNQQKSISESIALEKDSSLWLHREVNSVIIWVVLVYWERRPMTYPLELPSKLGQIYNVFQLPMLQSDHSYIISPTDVEI